MSTHCEMNDLDLERIGAGKEVLFPSLPPLRLNPVMLGSGFLAGRGPDAGAQPLTFPPQELGFLGRLF